MRMNRRPLMPHCAATGLHWSRAAASGARWHCARLLRRALLTLRVFVSFVGVLLTSHCASDAAGRGSGNRDPLVALSRVEMTRTIEPRLSITTAYRPCSSAVPTGGTVPRADCKAAREDLAPSSAVLDVAQRASALIGANADPNALHAAALIDLIWAGEGGIPLERSVSYLRTASRLAGRNAAVYADLAAALMVRGERHQTPRDLVEAIEMADVALELEPRNETARFNLALGLERLGLDGQAQRAWKAFLQLDSGSRWANEARQRPPAPAEGPRPSDPPPAGGSPAETSAYVEAKPEAAMLFGWDHALGDWGSALMAGDTVRANRALRLARTLGDDLERGRRDATLADAVRAIGAVAGGASGPRALAGAHRESALGRRVYVAGDNSAAGRSFERVLAIPGLSPPLAGWARFHRAVTLFYQGRLERAEVVVRPIVVYADTLRYPSLAGRARWALASISLRGGRYEQSMRAARAAATLFERSGESELAGNMQAIVVDALHNLTDRTEEY